MGVWHGATTTMAMTQNGSMVELKTINLFTAINYTASESIYDNAPVKFTWKQQDGHL